MEIRKTPLEPDKFYHIFNRGINSEKVFFEDKNYQFFLERYSKYVFPFVETYAYCLIPNHYHFLIRVRPEEEIQSKVISKKEKSSSWHVSNAFSSFLQSYTRAMNKVYSRSGAIFETPFRRIEVADDAYFTRLVSYIHQNPQKHKLTDDFKDYPYSSYWSHLSSNKHSKLQRKEVLDWFGGEKPFEDFHKEEVKKIEKELTLED